MTDRPTSRTTQAMKIGFIGLGLMGRGMAANLRKAGYDLVVNDLSPQAAAQLLAEGAVWAETAKELATACDLVFTSLPTPRDVEMVAFGESGLAAGFRRGAVWFDLSTNAVGAVRTIHERLAAKGVAFLDAPVSGGPAGAASGKLAIWVGGDKKVFDDHRKVLDVMADQVIYVGEIGAGSIAKLTHNMASAALSTVMAEVVTMGVKAGLEPLELWKAIRQGALGRMRTFEMTGNRFLPGKFDPPNFRLRLLQKDVALALELAREMNVPMRLCALVGQEITEAMNRGWGERDSQSVMLLQQERAGLPLIEVPIEKIRAVQDAG